MKARIEDIKEAWLPELKKLVSQIDTRYQKGFRELKCAGEVKLKEEGVSFFCA